MKQASWRRVITLVAACVMALSGVMAVSSPAQAAETADALPFKVGSGVVEVGCTWNNGCDGGYHTGTLAPAIDFIAPVGTAVYAAGPGTLQGYGGCDATNSPGCNGSAGNYVVITHPDGRQSRYLHLSSIDRGNGPVQRGDLIGKVGNSGANTTTSVAHLHYDETVNGAKVDPGAMSALHGTTTVSYPGVFAGAAGWNDVPAWSDRFVWSDGFGTTPATNTIVDLKKTVDSGGYQQVYTATSSRVRETWWGDGSVHTSEIIHIAQNNIVAIDKIVQPDGTQSLYTAVADGIWETYWRPNEGVHHSKIINLPNVKDVIATSKYENGEYVHLLYVLAADGPYEYWWKDNGQGIGHTRLAHIINPVAFVKAKSPGGVDQVYTATAGAVWETWWNPGQTPQTSSIIGISQNDIVDVDKHNLPNGTQILYTAVSTGVWESKWGGGLNLHHNKIVVNQSNVKRIVKRMNGTTHQLYMATGGHVQEYWWHATNSGSSTMITISQGNIRAIDRSSYNGVNQLYTAAGATVWETWWGGGSNPGTAALVTVG